MRKNKIFIFYPNFKLQYKLCLFKKILTNLFMPFGEKNMKLVEDLSINFMTNFLSSNDICLISDQGNDVFGVNLLSFS